MKKALTVMSLGSLLLSALLYLVFASRLISGIGFPFLPLIIAAMLGFVGIVTLNILLVASSWNSPSRALAVLFLIGEACLLLALCIGFVSVDEYPSLGRFLTSTPLSTGLSIAGVATWLVTLGFYSRRSH
ncbi:hypothetical protein [Arcanobacterium phocae]|uniref:hypothetical protein n=1 Tax=Arcanobacterium phocae TaxID=131112 RepID=UPI001C0EACC0|nr:hypothetical protein [Arcanobacterium phocae]